MVSVEIHQQANHQHKHLPEELLSVPQMTSEATTGSAAAGNEWTLAERRMKSAVLRVVMDCLKETSTLIQNYESVNTAKQFLSLLENFTMVVKRRMLFSAHLEYLYASQVKAVQMKTTTGNAISALESKLKESKESCQENLKAREELLDKINQKIKATEEEAFGQIVAIRAQAAEELKALAQQSNLVQNKLDNELLEKKNYIEQMEKNHLQLELDLRDKRKSIEDEIKITIDHYDQKMEDIAAQRADVSKQLQKKMDVLAVRQREFEVLEKRFNEIEEEKAEEERQRVAALQEEFCKQHSARIIQRAYQHFKMKKMLKKAQRKGKKKKDAKKK